MYELLSFPQSLMDKGFNMSIQGKKEIYELSLPFGAQCIIFSGNSPSL